MILWHMTGAGNTFLVADARGQAGDFSALAKGLCPLHGVDGFMALMASEYADFRLGFYNADGSRAAMCGNGARCICRFAYDNGIAGPSMTMETDSGPVQGQRLAENRYRVRLNDPDNVHIGSVSLVTVGVPHGVVEIPGLEFGQKAERLLQAAALRQKLDANVDFYCLTGPNTARVLTYERGVEGFTAACGTGCAAVATVLQAQSRLHGSLQAENQGGMLVVDIVPSGTYLTGPAEVLDILEI